MDKDTMIKVAILAIIGALVFVQVVYPQIAPNEEETSVVTGVEIGSTEVLIDATRDQHYPQSSGHWLVWQDYRNGNWDIYGYDVSTGNEVVIANNITNEVNPRIYVDHVVWAYNDGTNDHFAGMFLDNRTWWDWTITSNITNIQYRWDVFTDTVYMLGGGENYFTYNVWDDYVVEHSVSSSSYEYNLRSIRVESNTIYVGYLDTTGFNYEYWVGILGSNSVIPVASLRTSGWAWDVSAGGDIALVNIESTPYTVTYRDSSTGAESELFTYNHTGSLNLCMQDGWIVWNEENDITGESTVYAYNLDEEELYDVTEELYYGIYGVTVLDDYAYFTGEGESVDIFYANLDYRGETPNDSDGDGMDDDWEMEYFGSLNETADGDYDEDGYTNLEEFRAGTDPTDPTDYPQGVVEKNLLTIIIAIVGIGLLIAVEYGYYKAEHLKKINEKVPLGILISVIAIGLIVVYLIL